MTTPITLPHSTSHTVLVALLEGACHAASVLRGNLELLARERQHAEQPYAYVEAAEYIDGSDIDVVCLQHEFGLFGGAWGENILSLLEELPRRLLVRGLHDQLDGAVDRAEEAHHQVVEEIDIG